MPLAVRHRTCFNLLFTSNWMESWYSLEPSKEGMFFHPAYRKRSDGMCRFLCSASAYQPPTVGEQYFRGRNSDRKGAKSHAVRRVRLDAKAASPGLGVAPTSVSENPKGIFRYIARLRYPESGIPHTLRAKSIHQVLPMLSECASKNSFYICIVTPTRKDSSPGTRSRSPPWPSMIFRTEESPIP